MEHLIKDPFEAIVSDLGFAGRLLIEPEVLEPERSVFAVVLEAFIAQKKCFVDLSFSLLILRGFKIDGAVRLAVLD